MCKIIYEYSVDITHRHVVLSGMMDFLLLNTRCNESEWRQMLLKWQTMPLKCHKNGPNDFQVLWSCGIDLLDFDNIGLFTFIVC